MVVIKSIEKSSTFAWSNGKSPKLALGSLSGKIDANFSNDSVIEILDTFTNDDQNVSLAKITASSKFLDLAWSSDDSVIAGALENGTVEFYSFDKNTNELKIINSFKKHSASVQCLSFSKVNKNLLATGDAKGLINVWDISKISDSSYEPTSTGDSISSVDGVKSISWNNKIGHILASAGSSTGSVSIWDFNQKKEILHFNYQNPTSNLKVLFDIVEWHPTSGTTIATASNSDLNPAIILWDLRKTNTPLQVLENNGHAKGILSLDWCSQDSGLLLSSSSDCTVGLWDPEVEKSLIHKYPSRSNWIFKAKFVPSYPDYFAAASHDSVIEVQQLQDLQIDANIAELQEKQRQSNPVDKEEVVKNVEQSEDDFWNSLSSNNNQGSSSTATGSTLQNANIKKANQSQTFSLHIPKWLSTEGRRPAASWAFGGKMVRVLPDGKSVSVFTQPHAKDSDKDLKKQYDLLQNALKTKDFNAIISKRSNNAINNNNEEDWSLLDKISLDGKDAFFAEALALDGETDEIKDVEKEDDEEFFEKLEQEKLDLSSISENYEFGSDEILRSLINKDLKAAANSKLSNGDLLEALVIAYVSKNDDLKEKVLTEYFVKKAKTSKTSRLLYALSENKFDDLIEKTNVSEWKYVYKAITNYVTDETIQKNFFASLGEKLYKAGNRHDALIVYMSSGIFEKISSIWVDELREIEEGFRSSKNSAYEAHLESLTEFVERFSCFANFFESDGSKNSLIGGNPKIVSIVLEFINVICINGNFDLALNFLNILPSDNADVVTEKQRVTIASGKSQTPLTQSKYQSHAKNQTQARQINPGAQFFSSSIGHSTSISSVNSNIPKRAPIASLDKGRVSSNESIYASVAPVKAGHAKAAMYAPPPQQPLPQVPLSNQKVPSSASATVAPPQIVNPYMPKATIISSNSAPVPTNNSTASFATPPPIGRAPIQPQFISTSSTSEIRESPNKAPSDMVSGQKPVGNKHANAGWNDFALPLPGTASRAKAIGVKKEPSVVNTPVEKLAAIPNKPKVAHMSTPPPPKAAVRNLSSKNIAEQAEKAKSRVLSEKTTKYAPLGNIPIQTAQAVGTPPIVSPSIVTKKPPMPEHPKFNNPYAPAVDKNPLLTKRSSSNKFAPPPISNHYGAPTANATADASASIPPPPVKRQNTVASVPPPILNKQPSVVESVSELAAAPAESTVILDQENKEIEEDNEIFTEEESSKIQDYFLGRLSEVTDGLGEKLGPQIKDTQKRLTILNNHLKQKNLITERVVIEDILKIIDFLESQSFEEAKALQSKISNEYPEQAGKWLTGVKRFIGFSEAISAKK